MTNDRKPDILPFDRDSRIIWIAIRRCYRKTRRTLYKRSHEIQALSGILIVAVTAVYAVFAYMQWAAMRGQLTEMRKTTELTRLQLAGTQSAKIDYFTPTVNVTSGDPNQGKFAEKLINHGLTMATEVNLEIVVTRKKLSDLSPMEESLTFHEGPESVKAGEDIELSGHIPWAMRSYGLLKQWPADWPGEETTEIKGSYSYNNGYGDIIPKNFCFRWITMFSYGDNATTYGIGGMPSCDDTKSMIEWSFARKKDVDARLGRK